MQLILVRHADAEPSAATDAARPLTALGRAQAAALCRGLGRVGVVPDVILSSPAVRCRETAAALVPLAPGLAVTETPALASGRLDADALFDAIGHARCAVAVGHMPDIASFAECTLGAWGGVGDSMPFAKCAAASISYPGGPNESAGTLDWFVPPTWFMDQGERRGSDHPG